jgi:hypothetical protein
MRVMFWYCEHFGWRPAIKTLAEAPEAEAAEERDVVVAFVHVEPQDTAAGSSAETKLVKNAKWVARKWDVKRVILHSFTHLGDTKAPPEAAQQLLARAEARLTGAGYTAVQTPYGYFLDLAITAKGHPLARIYKAF